jgi:hypothetical protein
VCPPVYFPGPPCGSATCLLCPTSALRDFASRSATSVVSRHPKCRDPELLATSYRNSRLRDFRDRSLDFLSTDMPKCRNLTRRQCGSHNGTSRLFGVLDFVTSRILMLCSRFSDSRNPEMVNKGLTSVSTSMPPVHYVLSGSSAPSNL